MFRSPFRSLSLVALLALAPVACNSNNPFNPVTPTPTDPVTETFSGTLGVNAGATHTFVAAFPGDVRATLTALEPDSAAVLGFLLGVWNGSSCTVVTANDASTLNTALFGVATTTGQLCVRVYDVGRIAEPVTYTITVVHP